MTSTELPNDIDSLKKLVIQEHELRLLEHQRAELFKYRLEKLTRKHYGSSSEKIHEPDGQQLLFALPQPEEKPVESLVAEPTEESVPVKKHGGGRKPLSAHLPRKRIEYIVPENERRCPCCGEVMPPFGEEISEQLDIIPASYYVIQHVKFKYACAKKCAEKVVTAAGPDKVVDRGLAGPGLLAQSVIVKFGNHLPNFRTEVISDRDGLRIPRSTQCGWQATVASLLEPLYKRMIVYTVLSKKIHTDDTPISVLDPGRGKTKTARFWVYLGDKEHPFTVFDYTPNRKRDGPEKFLKDFKGYLQADAYAGYDQICAGPGVIGVGCWAHARRYFFDAKDTDVRANQLLAMVSEIYAVEALARPLNDAGRYQMRQLKTVPILARVKTWLDARVLDTLPKSPLGQALTYALNQWDELTRFTENGMLEADNNLAENALRPIAIGRKNYLFMGSDAGGHRAAILYSLVRTCERHDIHPWEYLKDVLVRIGTHPASQIDDLLPDRWKPK